MKPNLKPICEWQYYALGGLLVVLLLLWIVSKVRQYRLRRERDFTRRLETLLLPKETIKVICPGPQGKWVLTNKRLILEAGEGFAAFPFSKIKKVSGVDSTGKSTVAAGKMARVTVTAYDQMYTLPRRKGSFTELVKGLKASVNREKNKQKKRQTAKSKKETTKKETGKMTSCSSR